MHAGIYKHYRGGYYQVLGVAENATNDREGELFVVYVSLDATLPGPRMRVRRKHEFFETVQIPDGNRGVKDVQRFAYVGDQVPL